LLSWSTAATRSFSIAAALNKEAGREVAEPKSGDATNDTFRTQVYDDVTTRHGVVSICVPAAGITRDALVVRVNKETGKGEPYSITTFRQVTEVNLIAPIYWAIEMVVRIAEDHWRRGLKRWEPQEAVRVTPDSQQLRPRIPSRGLRKRNIKGRERCESDKGVRHRTERTLFGTSRISSARRRRAWTGPPRRENRREIRTSFVPRDEWVPVGTTSTANQSLDVGTRFRL
jgi:hypothetical protein